MTPTKKYLQPSGLHDNLSFDDYCSNIPEFYFKKEVPDDVIKNFEVVEKLLAHSYYEYKFIDEAYSKAIHTFEMAMSIRYKDFFPNPPKKKLVFNDFITILSGLNIFDTNFEVLKHIKYIRNSYSHPERHTFAGIVFWNRIEFIGRLINEMYEDVDLRLERILLSQQFIEKQQTSKLDKSLVLQTDDKTIILFSLRLLIINNKCTPHTHILAGIPIFDLESEEENDIKVPSVIGIKITNPVFSENVLIGEDYNTKETICFSSINCYKELSPKYKKWQEEYDKKKTQFLYESGINNNISRILIPEIQNFQKL